MTIQGGSAGHSASEAGMAAAEQARTYVDAMRAGVTLRAWKAECAAERRAALSAAGPVALLREFADGAASNLEHVADSERPGALAAVRLFGEAIGAGWSDATLAERVSETCSSLTFFAAGFLSWYHRAYATDAAVLFPALAPLRAPETGEGGR